MFNRDVIETKVRNAKGLFEKLAKLGEYQLEHDGKLGQALMGSHLDELRMLAESYGVDFSATRYTYTIKCYIKDGKPTVSVWQPRVGLRQGTAMLSWGDTYTALTELKANEDLFISPVITEGANNKKLYSITIGSQYGDVVFPIYPKKDVSPNLSQLNKALNSGEGWSAILEPPFPTDLKQLVSATKPTTSFNVVGMTESEKKGTTRTGQPFSIAELVLEDDQGNLYCTKNNSSRNSRDIRYWGSQATVDNPITFTIMFEGLGEYQGKPYTQFGVTCSPVHQEDVSLADLLELEEDEDTEDELDSIVF